MHCETETATKESGRSAIVVALPWATLCRSTVHKVYPFYHHYIAMTPSARSSSSWNNTVVALASALCGAALYAGIQHLLLQRRRQPPNGNSGGTTPGDPETDYSFAHAKVWYCIGGALQAAQIYIGDRLELYSTLRRLCATPGSSVTATVLAQETGLHQRWLREWLAQQASMGILQLLPADNNHVTDVNVNDDDEHLHYRLPWATAQVLANPESDEYDICMVAVVPSLVNRAKTMLPQAFATGLGRPYDEAEVSDAIDRQHRLHIRNVLIPRIIPSTNNGAALRALQKGCKVADLGCGAGNLVIAMARAYPNSTVHGYEVSEQALSVGATELVKAKLKNAFLIDAKDDPLGDHVNEYDVIMTYDVLHDAPNPEELIQQVKAALKPGGFWILGDICSKPSVRENIASNPLAANMFAFSTCLCMSCSLSTPDGAGLGTLGFTVPVAEKMLHKGGFKSIKVVHEEPTVRWFEVMELS